MTRSKGSSVRAQTNGRTDDTKYIISLASRSIIRLRITGQGCECNGVREAHLYQAHKLCVCNQWPYVYNLMDAVDHFLIANTLSID